MKKNNSIRLVIVLGTVCIILLGGAIVLSVFYFQMQPQLETSVHKVDEQKAIFDSKKQELEILQSEIDALSDQLNALQSENENQQKDLTISSDGGELSLNELEEGAETSSIDDMEPGTIIPAGEMNPFGLENYFKTYEVSEGDAVYSRIIGKSYQPNGDIDLSELRYMKLVHYNFEGEIQVGELIVNANLVDDYRSAFQQLFEKQYQIQSMYLIDNYWTGDADSTDSASIDVNNTSAFNYRLATGGSSLSKHAYGCAIDINPQQNPYAWYSNGSLVCNHENAQQYLDRTSGAQHVITYDDLCYQVFTSLGFAWGGDWESVKDYQHFEKAIY